MWISRSAWEKTLERIEKLERATGMVVHDNDYEHPPRLFAGHVAYTYFASGVPINKVVEALARESDLRKCYTPAIDAIVPSKKCK